LRLKSPLALGIQPSSLKKECAMHGSQGTKVYIGPAAPDGDVTEAAYSGLEWTEIKDVETFSGFAKDGNDVTFTPLDGDEEALKGARKVIEATVTCGRNPTDPGQVAAEDAEADRFKYALKVVFNDAKTASYTDSVIYWKALVMSAGPAQVGGGNDVTKTVFRLRGKSADMVPVPSALIGS
jgi:hypothetical protein